jgi:RHS repeat-associated protein
MCISRIKSSQIKSPALSAVAGPIAPLPHFGAAAFERMGVTFLLLLAVFLLSPTLARADGPDSKSGVRPQVISLPSGPGSLKGIGEAFEPELSTGTASYPVKFAVPPGVAGFQPDLTLNYNGGNGNGPWGLGWKLNVPYLQRQTDEGLPSYDDDLDRFIYSSGEKLVRLSNGDYRFENEGQFMRFRRLAGGGWEGCTPVGVRYLFGESAAAQVTTPYGVFRWHLERQIDPHGNEIRYFYTQDGGYAYLEEIRYNFSSDGRFNAIHFSYEFSYEQPRPDVFTDRTSRAPITIARRAVDMEMRALGDLVRRYRFDYVPERSTGVHSLLRTVTQIGDDGVSALPPFTFTYTEFIPTAYATISMQNPPPLSLKSGDADLVDISYDGLPDLVHTPAGGHRYYLNRGQGRWQAGPTYPNQSPPDRLSSPNVRIADMDSNGQADLLIKAGSTSGSPFYYYAGRPAQAWEKRDRINYNLTPPFDLNDPNLRLVDMNHDKRTDILLTTDSRYFVWLARADNTWPITADAAVPSLAVGTPLLFSDRRVKLGDMTGDRLQDMVFTRDGLVKYFPHNGNGDYDVKGVLMDGAPTGLGDLDKQLELADLNGDGLDDLVLPQDRSVRYWLNRGDNSFSAEFVLTGTPAYNQADTAVRVADMDGDGASELLFNRSSAPPDEVDEVMQYVDFNTGPKPLLLESIDNGLGRTISITCQASTAFYVADWDSGQPWETRLPFPVQVVSRVTVHDANSGADYVTDYAYRDGYYDGREKEFRGFAHVTETEYGDDSAPTTVTRYCYDTGAQEESRKGLVLEMAVLGENGQCQEPVNECYRRQVNQLTTRSLYGDGKTTLVAYSFITQTDTYIHENQPAAVQLRQTFDRDDYGNLIQDFNFGQVCGSDLTCGHDEVLTSTQYALNESAWIVNKPAVITHTDAAGNFVSEKRLYYDGAAYTGLPSGQIQRGDLARLEESLGPTGEDRFIPTKRQAFDRHGNPVGLMDANGNLTTVEYDPLVHTFPVLERLHLDDERSLVYTATYHVGFGQVTAAADFNGHVSTFGYDTFGRLSQIVRPGDTPAQPTVQYSYVLGSPRSSITTEQRERSDSADVLRRVTYFDGLGRKLQLRREAEGGQVVVEEAVIFNARQSQREQFLPYFADSFDYAPPRPNLPKTDQYYDPLGRTVRTVNPDGSFTAVAYQPLAQIRFDEEDNRPSSSHAATPKTLRYDGLERLVGVQEINRVGGKLERYETSYRYDPLGNLTGITDAQGNVKTMQYDALSRKVYMDDPDRGEMVYRYDDNGNLTGTRDAKGQVVGYRYDAANRALAEQWVLPDGTIKNHAIYHYDDDLSPLHPDARNTRGQIAYIEDEAGQLLFSYDDRGKVAGQIRRFEADGLEFATRMAYDAMERLIELTYPDGTVITYEYNAQGLLERIPGFVDNVNYTAADQRQAVDYANGIATTYTYDIRLRLQRLHSVSGAATLQDLTYGFDDASNIVSIADSRPDRKNENDQTQNFVYDDLYRLTRAGGSYGEITHTYDSLGNMVRQTSTAADPRLNLGDMRYGEDEAGPHALTFAGGEARAYDANGNLIRSGNATYTWDFRDRLTLAVAGALTSTYSYDADGQRTRQTVRSGDAMTNTLYLGQYAEVRGHELVKYVFNGRQRLAQVTTSFEPDHLIRGFDGDSSLPPPAPTETRWYLLDHLDSASLQVDENGQVTSEVVYYPYGLTRYELAASNVRYRFTGKELDATGLHYYGARYYDATTGRFVSVDPLYMEQPERGLEDPQALNKYLYALNNPLKYSEPEGLDPWYGNYLGPGNKGYDKPPVDQTDEGARQHDIAYGGRGGVWDALTNIDPRIINADRQLAIDSFKAIFVNRYYNGPTRGDFSKPETAKAQDFSGRQSTIKGRLWAGGAALLFGAISTYKTVARGTVDDVKTMARTAVDAVDNLKAAASWVSEKAPSLGAEGRPVLPVGRR